MTLDVQEQDGINGALVEQSMQTLFSQEMTGAFAVAAQDGSIRSWTAYVALSNSTLYFTSQANTQHAEALNKVGSCSLALWRRPTEWGEPLYGLQLYGRCVEISDPAEATLGIAALHRRFPGTVAALPDENAVIGNDRKTCLFAVSPTSGKIIDEAQFGPRNFVAFLVTP